MKTSRAEGSPFFSCGSPSQVGGLRVWGVGYNTLGICGDCKGSTSLFPSNSVFRRNI